jgi:hypothetical protein
MMIYFDFLRGPSLAGRSSSDRLSFHFDGSLLFFECFIVLWLMRSFKPQPVLSMPQLGIISSEQED